jgi:hypothetical protein
LRNEKLKGAHWQFETPPFFRGANDTLTGKGRKLLSTLVMLLTWSIWRQRNSRIFEKVFKPINILVENIKAEAKQWALASAGRFVLGEG